jgi:hypothetical protein
MKVSQNAKFGLQLFSAESQKKIRFQVRRQFQHFKYDMKETLVKCPEIKNRPKIAHYDPVLRIKSDAKTPEIHAKL